MKHEKSTADRISQLPDDILHRILRRVDSPITSAQTIALSSRWRSLWRSYPVVEFDRKYKYWHGDREVSIPSDLQKFGRASLQRFSRNGGSPIEALKLSYSSGSPYLDFEVEKELAKEAKQIVIVFRRLLDLAFEREVEEIAIVFRGSRTLVLNGLRFQSLCNSGVEILELEGIAFPLPLTRFVDRNNPCFLRFLRLNRVNLRASDQDFAYLISNCTLLETLELIDMIELEKIKIPDLPSLKTLKISTSSTTNELEIAASALETLCLEGTTRISKFELEAPRLNCLQITDTNLMLGNIAGVISKLPSLKTLTLTASNCRKGKNLSFSSANLEKFELSAPHDLEVIELNAGAGLSTFRLEWYRSLPDKLRRCEIICSPAPIDPCRLEVDFKIESSKVDCPKCWSHRQWFAGFKSFVTRFPQFHTVSIKFPGREVNFKEEEMGDSTPPVTIKHLRIQAGKVSEIMRQEELLDGLFWACRPRFLTVFDDGSACHDQVYQIFLNLIPWWWQKPSKLEEFKEGHGWRSCLKDVKITTRDIDRIIAEENEEGWAHVEDNEDGWTLVEDNEEGWTLVKDNEEGEGEELTSVWKLLKLHKRVSFKLTWH